MSGAERNFSIPVSNGIFAHRLRIGAAIWVFLWLVDHTTKEIPTADGKVEGLVHGGQPVALGTIASDLNMSRDAIFEHLAQLASAGYIRKIVHGIGRANGYAVMNSKRFSNRRTKPGGSNPQTVVQNAAGTPVQIAMGTVVQNAIDPPAFVGGVSYKSPSVYKERLLQDSTRHKSNGDEPIAPEMVAQAVLQTLSLSGRELLTALVDICRSELKRGEHPDSLRNCLVAAWNDYSSAQEEGQFTSFVLGPAKFFGHGAWKSRKKWPWKEGAAGPGAKSGNRGYDTVENVLAVLGAPPGAA